MSASLLPLTFDAVTYRVGEETLLGPIDLRIEAASKTVILGPNGAGKSLLLRLAHGLLSPSSGRVSWAASGGSNSSSSSDKLRLRTRQAMVFDRPVLLRRTARANVEYGLALRGVSAEVRRARGQTVLERTGLAAIADRAARALSAGEQQRLAIARAWVLEPEVLFLDEPTASLDPAASRSIEELVESIAAAGTKIVMTTHQLGLARRFADEVVFLHRGLLSERAGSDAFFAAPQSREAQAFLAGELLW
jgi:tungstate transport system ATP-binding protein